MGLRSAEYNSPMSETPIGSYLFPDGITRPAFQDKNDGWQYVLEEYGRRVYSMWLFTEAEWQACTEPVQTAESMVRLAQVMMQGCHIRLQGNG
jgi:hypothetical protein